ncbi:MAG: class I SAM-dependent methyltransferase [Pseudomonadota bacterium]
MTQAGTAWPALEFTDLLANPSGERPFPLIGDLPCLYPDPAARISLWRRRWRNELQQLEAEQARLKPAVAAAQGASRDRLKQRFDGLSGQRRLLEQVLAPLLNQQSPDAGAAGALAMNPDPGWYRYDANPFRDWCWGEAENAATLSQLLLALTDRPQHVLQLGSGAGRLAYDLHRSLEPAMTVAVEHNPLLALLGAQLAEGGTQQLWEFPLSPISVADTAVQHTLSRPAHHGPLQTGLITVLADVLSLPFRPGQFDLVVTSWFSDICPAPVPWLCTTIGALLRPGGLWINHGSAAFDSATIQDCGSLTELLAIAEQAGLSLSYAADVDLPYLQSPYSRQQRIERVGTQAFRKPASALTPEQLTPFEPRRPNWAEDATVPIAASRAFAEQREASALRTFILSMVDGKRSRRDIAEQLAARGILPAADAEAALTELLLTIQQ